jgi:hypothetical protein
MSSLHSSPFRSAEQIPGIRKRQLGTAVDSSVRQSAATSVGSGVGTGLPHLHRESR